MQKIINFIMSVINNSGIYGPVLACLLLSVESIIPVLPLAFFITFNFLYFGELVGFIISWIFTILGCIISFLIFRKGIQGWFSRLTKDKDKLNNLMSKFDNISFTGLVVLIALPFTPAFLINIAAGLSEMKFRKFFFSLVIGKIGLVYFWGYVGTNLIESITNPLVLVKIIILIVIEFIISKVVNKLLKI